MAEYITREAAIEAVKQSTGVGNTAFIDRFDALNRIGIISAADVQPVRHGRWLPVDELEDAFDCSECDAMVSKRLNYCPNCGAKMDAEARE